MPLTHSLYDQERHHASINNSYKEIKVNEREQYNPGPAAGVHIQKDGEKWTLVLVRELRHPPAMVWEALTDPSHLSQWAPFDADRNLAAEGRVKFCMTGTAHTFETVVKRAEAPHLLEYSWGESDLRWQLEPHGRGTRLTLWHNIDRRFISWGAAGWHIAFDVLDRQLSGHPIGRIAGPGAMQFPGWQRLRAEYALQFGIEKPVEPATPENQADE